MNIASGSVQQILNIPSMNNTDFSEFDRLSDSGHHVDGVMDRHDEMNGQIDHYHMQGIKDEHAGHGGHGHEMKMWFHFGCHEIILFEFWQIESLYGLLLSCLLIFIMACLYEWIKWFRVYLQILSAKCPPSCRHANNDDGKLAEVKQDDDKRADCCGRSVVSAPLRIILPPGYQQVSASTRGAKEEISVIVRCLQAVLYFVQLTLAYCLMLIAMTYNIWLTLAVITGAAFGHWLFAILKCFNPQTDDLDTFSTDACH